MAWQRGFAVLLLTILLGFIEARAKDPRPVGDDTSLDAASYLQSYAANLEGIRKGDCLIRYEEVLDTGATDGRGAFHEAVTHCRLTFDRDTKRYFFLRDGRGLIGEYGADEEVSSTKESRVFEGFCAGSSGGIRRSSFFAVSPTGQSAEELSDHYSMPNLYHVGFVEWGVHRTSEYAARSVSLMTSGAMRATVSPPPDRPAERRRLQFFAEYDNGQVTVFDLLWNDEKQVPERWTVRSRWEDDQGVTQERVDGEERYVWEQVGGVYVPVMIRKFRTVAFPDRVTGKVLPPTGLFQTAELHWFSVNEALPDEMLDPGRMHATDELVRATDPAKSGAKF